MTITVLMVPGYRNSDPQHWQSLWERSNPEYRRVRQRDWDNPVRYEWVEMLDKAVTDSSGEIVLVAHSLGCATVAHWASQYKRHILAALLVAPTDVSHPEFEHLWVGYQPMPLCPLGFRSIVVASSNDPYVSLERAQLFASSWGSQLVNIGVGGHITTADGFGEWQQGKELLRQLIQYGEELKIFSNEQQAKEDIH
jgi:hypothetical protein